GPGVHGVRIFIAYNDAEEIDLLNLLRVERGSPECLKGFRFFSGLDAVVIVIGRQRVQPRQGRAKRNVLPERHTVDFVIALTDSAVLSNEEGEVIEFRLPAGA